MMAMLNDDDDRPCTVQELDDILTASTGGLAMCPSRPYDEVFDGIFIGEGDSAKSVGCMKRLGITHVLNSALGDTEFHVNTSQETYEHAKIKFLGTLSTDTVNQDLTQYFDQANEFIDDALKSDGRVFVHCVQGMSRSATLVLSYLMTSRHMTVKDATRLVRTHREIFPNVGFLQQLCDLNERLKTAGHFKKDACDIVETVSEEDT